MRGDWVFFVSDKGQCPYKRNQLSDQLNLFSLFLNDTISNKRIVNLLFSISQRTNQLLLFESRDFFLFLIIFSANLFFIVILPRSSLKPA